MTVLADFVLLGHQGVGSFALSSDKTELFSVALGAFLDLICEVFNNQAIPRLIDINGEHFKGISGYPELIHGDIETQDLSKLGEFVSKMVGIGAITPDESMEDYLRMSADLPEKDLETAYGQQSGEPDRMSELHSLLSGMTMDQVKGFMEMAGIIKPEDAAAGVTAAASDKDGQDLEDDT